MANTPTHRRCRTCQQPKPLAEFGVKFSPKEKRPRYRFRLCEKCRAVSAASKGRRIAAGAQFDWSDDPTKILAKARMTAAGLTDPPEPPTRINDTDWVMVSTDPIEYREHLVDAQLKTDRVDSSLVDTPSPGHRWLPRIVYGFPGIAHHWFEIGDNKAGQVVREGVAEDLLICPAIQRARYCEWPKCLCLNGERCFNRKD